MKVGLHLLEKEASSALFYPQHILHGQFDPKDNKVITAKGAALGKEINQIENARNFDKDFIHAFNTRLE